MDRPVALKQAVRDVPIDIVVPVYNAADDLARCVESVLAHTPPGAWRLVLIDDGSSDPALRSYLGELKRRRLPQLELLANDSNLGFTLTANRGMSLSRSDVVLLNSDTMVTRGWLEKLARCAASDPRIGTITPFSNNAEICSLPQFCANNPWPTGQDADSMVAALERAAAPTYPDLPTGVGFCLYIRRTLLDAVGRFDPAFGLGYGEENDFCLRAAAAGFRNVLCEDAFVLHLGGSSFGEKRADLAERNMRLLLARHPGYLDLVHGYIAADPLLPLRALALSQHRVLTGPPHGILHVVHGHGGGTEYHVRMLIAASAGAFRQYLLVADGDNWRLEQFADGEVVSYAFRRAQDELWSDFLGGLAARFGIGLIHLHNISGCREAMLTALAGLRIPYGYTVHDLNFACPTINFLDAGNHYCHGVTDETACRACLAAQREFAGIDIAVWRRSHRALLDRAAFVIAPSQWSATMLERYFPGRAVAIVRHGSGEGAPREDAVRTRVDLPDDGIPTVAVIGAIGPDKGSRRLERMVELTRARGIRLRWVLIGYLDRSRAQTQSEDAVFTQHGPFDSREIGALLDHYRVRLVAYPSVGPETFSFTLSEAWAHARPVIVPPIGALAERVGETGGGWILAAGEWEDDERMLARIAAVLDPSRSAAWDEAAARAKAAPQPTLAAMAEATIALWRTALEHPPVHARPISATRCLAALGYRAWRPPAAASSAPTPAPAKANGPLGRIAHTALAIRHTLPGRLLYRLTPKPLVDALRKRL